MRYYNKAKRIVLLILILSFSVHPMAFAHEYAHDGSITVVLHSDPNDQPIANTLTTLHFEIQDSENKFSLKNCDCSVNIFQNGKSVFKEKLSKANSKNLSVFNSDVTFTFPKKGSYVIDLKGIAENKTNLAPFEVKYNLNIAKQNNADLTVKLFLSIFTLIGAVLIIYFVYRSYKLIIKKPTQN